LGQAGTETHPETQTAAKITLACAPGQPRSEAVRSLLAALVPAPDLHEYDDLAAALVGDSPSPVLVPVQPPLDALTDALALGALPSQALQDWRARSRALLEECRPHRRKVLLIDNESLIHAPRHLAPLLFARLDLAVPNDLPVPEDRPRPVRPVLEALAHAMLAHSAPVRALADEMEAMMLTASDPATLPTTLLDLAYQEVRDQDGLRDSLTQYEAEIADLRESSATLSEERDLLRTSLTQLRDEMAAQVEVRRQQDDRTRDQEADLMLHKAAHDSARRQLEFRRAEHLQREAVLGAELLEARSRETGLRQEVDALSGELDRVFASRSWRVTTPLRRLRGGS
jgi:hypothetical protein